MKKTRSIALERVASGIATSLLCAVALSPALGAESSGPIPDFMTGAWGLDCRHADGTDCLSNSAFVRVPGDYGPGPVMQHPDYPYDGETTRRMADTNNPILQPWVKEQMDIEVARVMEGMLAGAAYGIPFVPTSRCWPGGVPGSHLYTGNVYYFQTPDQVWIHQTRDQTRRIYLNQEHSEDPPFTWFGESVGHYENGDTLVIDTIALEDIGPIDRLNTPHSRQLHVIERHRIVDVDGERRIEVVFTVEDPGVFTQPWMAKVEYEQLPDARWTEWVCMENSRDFTIPEEELVPAPTDNVPDF